VPAETLVHILRDNYTEAKVRGKKSFLLERQQLYSLAEFRTQTEILGFLADGPYGPELSKLQESSTPVEVERAVRLSFARSLKNLVSTAKGNVKQFLIEYTRRFEAYDLAALVLFRSQEKPWEEYASTRLPLGLMNEKELHKLYSAEDLESLASQVGDKKLQERLEGIQLEGLTPDKASLVRDIFNGWGDERFYNFINKKLGGRDKESCLPIVGSSIDLLNISIILRSKLIGISGIQSHLAPVRWKLLDRGVNQLVSSEDLSQALDRSSTLPYYRKVLSGARQRYEEAKSLSFLELLTRKHMLDQSRSILLGFPYTLGVELAFLVLKENEARNLAAVVSGVGAGLKPEQVRPLIVA
jgi:V/A-type H+/Na+-transporting ATPase subunit C